MDANEKVLDLLQKPGTPKKAAELVAESGLAKSAVDKALKQLKTKGIIDCPKVCYYAIKK